MTKPTFAEKKEKQLLSHIEKEAVEKENNHFRAYPALASIAIAMTMTSDRDVFFDDINEKALLALRDGGIDAEIYALRGDMGNGAEDSVNYLRVTRRGDHEEETPRLPLGAYQKYVIRASTSSYKKANN